MGQPLEQVAVGGSGNLALRADGPQGLNETVYRQPSPLSFMKGSQTNLISVYSKASTEGLRELIILIKELIYFLLKNIF